MSRPPRITRVPRVAATVVAVAGVVLFAGAPDAAATLIVVPNASFENPNVADNAYTEVAPPSWTFLQSFNGTITTGVWDPINNDYSGSTGNNAALPGAAAGGQAGYIALEQADDLDPQFLVGQLTSAASLATIQSAQTYTLNVALGNAQSVDPGDVRLSLVSDDLALATVFIPAGTLPENTFTNFTVTYTTDADDPMAGSPLQVRITHTYEQSGFRSIEFDNVRLEANPIPEPTTAGTAALLLLGALTPRRRRRGSSGDAGSHIA